MNLYKYVGNSSINFTDAFGLASSKGPLGQPPESTGYKPPKNWNGKKVKNPNGSGSGYPSSDGKVWVPTNHKGTHGWHWDVQDPKTGNHEPVYPSPEDGEKEGQDDNNKSFSWDVPEGVGQWVTVIVFICGVATMVLRWVPAVAP